MSTRRLPALLPLLLLCASSPARAELFLPVQPGATWHYHATDSADPRPPGNVTVRITGTEKLDGRVTFRVETVAGDAVLKTELISVDATGVHCHRRTTATGKTQRFKPPQMLLPAELKTGTTWSFLENDGTREVLQEFTVAGVEEITVPAGKFRAFRLHCDQPWPISSTIDRWFVPGTGMVKETTTTRGPTGRLLGRATMVLKNFSIEKTPAAGSPVVETPHETPAPVAALATPTPTAAPTPSAPAATATPTPEMTVQAEVSSERDGEPATEFKSDTPNLYLSWAGENLPPNAEVRVAWIAEDVGDLVEPNFVVDESTTTATTPQFGARFTLSRPRDGWAPGRYRVDVFVDDQLAASTGVSIHD